MRHYENIITSSKDLMTAALQQGVAIIEQEAYTILGYFEGHDYGLAIDTTGSMIRFDKQDGEKDKPYTLIDVVEFCQSMNEELKYDNESPNEPDEEYLVQLQKDERLFDILMERIGNSFQG